MPNKAVDASTKSNCLEIVNRVQTIYALKLPHYMVLALIGTSISFMRTALVLLNTDSGYNITSRSFLHLSRLATSRVSRLRDLSSEGCQRKSPTNVVSHGFRHTIWKCCLQEYHFGYRFFQSGSFYWHSIYVLPRQLYSMYLSASTFF